MSMTRHHTVRAQGLNFDVVEQGKGPLVLLCHGFPETSHAWRHQLPALAQAGYRAVAPDLRGFGGSDCPASEEAYGLLELIGDLVGMVDALGEPQAVLVGNDWGATLAWQAARLRPDRFRAVASLGVPLMSRAPLLPSQVFPRTDDTWFYVHYFLEHGLAEHDLQANVELSLRKIYFAASGDAGPRDEPTTPNPFGLVPRKQAFLDTLPIPAELPSWLAPEDMHVFVKAFSRTGFTGGLNYYRNLDRNWRCDAAFDGLRVEVPALYMVGERDTGLAIPGMKDIIQAIPSLAPQLRGSHVIPKAGHWLPQEAPDAVNAALLGFLRSL